MPSDQHSATEVEYALPAHPASTMAGLVSPSVSLFLFLVIRVGVVVATGFRCVTVCGFVLGHVSGSYPDDWQVH